MLQISVRTNIGWWLKDDHLVNWKLQQCVHTDWSICVCMCMFHNHRKKEWTRKEMIQAHVPAASSNRVNRSSLLLMLGVLSHWMPLVDPMERYWG
eukprot:scaffold74394_cov21-Tisochrysis_lutea.AAC.1